MTGEELRSFLPSGLDKDGEAVSALFADSSGGGTLADELDEALPFLDYYSTTGDVSDFEGGDADLLAKLFCLVSRIFNEGDERLWQRALAWTDRGGDSVWGTRADLERVCANYFGGTCYLCESVGDAESDLLKNGDFEDMETGATGEYGWTFSGGASRTAESRFEGRKGAQFASGGMAKQTVALDSGWHVMHVFCKGEIEVRAKNGGGEFWNFEARKWQAGDACASFSCGEWSPCRAAFRCGEAGSVEISISGEGWADYARLWKKAAWPSMSFVLWFEGMTAEEGVTAWLFANGEDPVEGKSYGNKANYFDKSYFTGKKGKIAESAYSDFLAKLKPVGVEVFAEFVMRSEEEE